MDDVKRIEIAGRAVPVRGNDIDTDRIIPARYLRTVTFEGLGDHAFEDDRAQLAARGNPHPFDQARYHGAQILLCNNNFGCGSSREHAPQALVRWGIRAIVGQSFAEIFYGNCIALGVPCPTLGGDDIEAVMQQVEQDPSVELKLDLKTRSLTVGDRSYSIDIPEGPRQQFLEGSWDSTTELLAAKDEIRKAALEIPYFSGFAS